VSSPFYYSPIIEISFPMLSPIKYSPFDYATNTIQYEPFLAMGQGGVCRSEFYRLYFNRPPLLCVYVYIYTLYVKQRAEKQQVRNLPRHSRTEGQLVRWPASLQKVFTLLSLLTGRNGRKRWCVSILHMCVSNYESNKTQAFFIHIR
jgi:hypothetical protein